ncbi:unnamed protein product [Closterium sp. NIES-53]
MLMLQDKFKCKALGDVSFYLGLHIERDVEKRCTRVHQRKYLEALAANFGQSEGHVATSFPSGFKCVKGPEEESVGEVERRRFHSLVGSLMYAAVNTRPDVAFATGQLARVVQCPNEEQVAVGMRVAKYLGQTLTVGLQYSAAAQRRQKSVDGVEPGRLFLTAFSDASFASEPENMTSVGGFICCVVARYSSPATSALGHLLLPYLFPELSAFATVEDLVSHLRASDACYRAAIPAEFLDRNRPPMYITLYLIVTHLPDFIRSVRDHFLSLDPTTLTVDLEQHLLTAETSAVAVGAARRTHCQPFFEGCSSSPLAPSYASTAAVDVSVTEDVGAASTSGKLRSSKGKGGRGGGCGSGGGGGGSGSGGGGCSGGGGGGGTIGGSGGSGGGGGGSDPLPGPAPVQVAVSSGAARVAASGGAATGGAASGGVNPGGAASEGAETGGVEPHGAASCGGSAGALPSLSPWQLREWLVRRTRLQSGASGAGGLALLELEVLELLQELVLLELETLQSLVLQALDLGFARATTGPSLLLRTDTSLPPFYVLVYVDDLVFATADTEALTLVKSELQKRHTCTDLDELHSYLGLQITRDRAWRTITLTHSHMVHQVLQRFGFQFSSPQPTPLSTSHSLSAPPLDESVEPSGPYPNLWVASSKRVLRYLCSTLGMGLLLGGWGPVVLTGQADTSCVDDSATQRSSQGYPFILGSGFQSGQLRLAYVATSANTADIFTKALPPGDQQRFSTVLGLSPESLTVHVNAITMKRAIAAGADVYAPAVQQQFGLTQPKLDELRKQLDYLFEKKFIRPSSSPFAALILFTPKMDGRFRMCIDFRALNRVRFKSRCPIPRADELIDQLRTARIFSKIDLRGGYHQIRIEPSDCAKTALRIGYGSFEYTVMPFGLTNAPAIFHITMNEAFRPLLDKCVIVYLDDILVYRRDKQQHLADLEAVFTVLDKNRLLTKGSKCEFFQDRLEFLGHVIFEAGVEIDPKKLDTMKPWHPPTNITELQSFLGFVYYVRRFVPDMARLTAPLTDLLRKGITFTWGEKEHAAFSILKNVLCSPPVLRIANPHRPFEVVTDASDIAIGAVLLQDFGNGLQHIAYESRKLHPLRRFTRYTIAKCLRSCMRSKCGAVT